MKEFLARRLGVLTLACVSFQQNAGAADWDGLSISGMIGATQQNLEITASGRPGGPNYFSVPSDFTQIADVGSNKFSGRDLSGSLKVGYSRQSGNIVSGIDLSVDSSFDQSQTKSAAWISAAPAQISITQKIKADRMVSIRPRIGWAWDNKLVYVTAGWVAARVTLDTAYSDTFISAGFGGASGTSSKTETKTGTVIGIGGDYALDKAWSLSAQYLYTNLGNLRTETTVRHLDPAQSYDQIDTSADLRTHSVMLGVTYRFKD